jgi:Uma2 family endonuclease
MSTAAASSSSSAYISVPPSKHWTVDEFHAHFGEPTYSNHQFMLIEGEVLERPTPTPLHCAGIGLVQQALQVAFDEVACIRSQMPLVLSSTTDAMPDLAVVAGTPRDYPQYPRSAQLVVEVAESSLAYDTRDKANLYAAGGIAEYWVVDLVNRQLHVFRDPTIDAAQPFGAYYHSRQSLDVGATTNALSMPNGAIKVSDLMP